MPGRGSLNVAAAAAICLFERVRQIASTGAR
jgi:tRNA G18 (ribose-2'-O)-methylase SpoU